MGEQCSAVRSVGIFRGDVTWETLPGQQNWSLKTCFSALDVKDTVTYLHKKNEEFKQKQFLQLSQAAKLSNLSQKNTESTKENSAGMMTATVSFRSFKSE